MEEVGADHLMQEKQYHLMSGTGNVRNIGCEFVGSVDFQNILFFQKGWNMFPQNL